MRRDNMLKDYFSLDEDFSRIIKNSLSDKEIICFDEFTSVVNREVAKIASYAISKCVKKQNKKFIAISCHYDIIDWLEPDWIFCTDNMKFEICKKKDQKLDAQYMNVKKIYGRFLENIII